MPKSSRQKLKLICVTATGYDNIDMTCLVLWLALMGHTIKRIIQIQRDKNGTNNRQHGYNYDIYYLHRPFV